MIAAFGVKVDGKGTYNLSYFKKHRVIDSNRIIGES
jgi:hypothetical protein